MHNLGASLFISNDALLWSPVDCVGNEYHKSFGVSWDVAAKCHMGKETIRNIKEYVYVFQQDANRQENDKTKIALIFCQ